MKITSVTTTSLATPGWNIIRLHAGPELQGIAFAPSALVHSILQLATTVLEDADPRSVVALWQRMDAATRDERSGIGRRSAAALDIALWDLKAKANDEPLWKTLGASRPRVNTHLRCEFEQNPEASIRQFGFRAAKLVVSGDLEATREQLRAMRTALGNDASASAIMLDAAERWSPKEAIRFVRQLESEFDLTWVESPVPNGDVPGHKRVSDSIRAAVCAGGGNDVRYGLLASLRERALDVVRLDTAECGITGTLQWSDAAFGFELPVALTRSPGNLHAHVAAALPYCMSMEVAQPAVVAGIQSDTRIEGGWAIVGDRPGHGIEITTAESA